MSDDLNAAFEALKAKMEGQSLGSTIKFDIEDEGVIRIVDDAVTTDDGDADCTISATMQTFRDMFEGELDPTAAYMTGKISIDGDMGVAMKLGQLLG